MFNTVRLISLESLAKRDYGKILRYGMQTEFALFCFVNAVVISMYVGAAVFYHRTFKLVHAHWKYFGGEVCDEIAVARTTQAYSHSIRKGEVSLAASGLYAIFIALVTVTLTNAF